MGELTQEDYEAALRRGAADMAVVPRALSARYLSRGHRLLIELANGATFSVPVSLLQGLEEAAVSQIAKVELSPSGLGLHLEALDVDFTVAGLLAGRFGNPRYMRERFGESSRVEAAE